MTRLVLDASLCDGCNLCLAACRYGGLAVKDGRIIRVEAADCRDCQVCEYICNRGALSWNYEIVLTEAGMAE